MVEQEDIRKDEQSPFGCIILVLEQLITTMYADGLLISFGSPRQHIWTYTCDNLTSIFNCPGADGGLTPPPFVGNNFYCESGAADTIYSFYFNDPLWDRSVCISSQCCDNSTQPWFYRVFNQATTYK